MTSLSKVHRCVDARLEFARSVLGETYLSKQYIAYPFHVTRPFYLEHDPPGMPTLYLQSVSGGLYGADEINLGIVIEREAMAQVTTQASTICHSMKGGEKAHQRLTLRVQEDAFFEYLADPVILFPGTKLANTVMIDTKPGASVLVVDSFLAHDPNAGDGRFDTFEGELGVTRDGELRCLDRFVVDGNTFAELGPFTAHGTLAWVSDADTSHVLAELNTYLAGQKEIYAGASLLPNNVGVWARVLAHNSHLLREVLTGCWQLIRKSHTGIEPARRRK